MYKKLMIVVVMAICFCFKGVEGKNLLENSGFEDGKSGWNLNEPWSMDSSEGKDSSNSAFIKYSKDMGYKSMGKNKIAITPGKYYCMSLWCKSEGIKKDINDGNFGFFANIPNIGPVFTYTSYNSYPFWTQVVSYFNSYEFDNMDLVVYVNEKIGSGKMWVDDVELEELTDKQLKGNLVSNPDFEEGEEGDLPCLWFEHSNDSKVKVFLDSTAEFIRGEKSLQIDASSITDNSKATIVKSKYVPSVPGKDYIFSVWLKAKDTETNVEIKMEGWLTMYRNKEKITVPHWYKIKSYQVDTEWRKYSLSAHIPGPGEENYLEGRLIMLFIVLKGKGTLWVDEVKFLQE